MSFTDLLNKGIKKYIDKSLKKRNFEKCGCCGEFGLLVEYMGDSCKDPIKVCERCYDEWVEENG